MLNYTPLAEALRPKNFDSFQGQKKPLAKLRLSIEKKRPRSFLFWGPPGCGKTTLAKLYASSFSYPVASIHATTASTKELKAIIDRAKNEPLFSPTIVWIDEVHRLTRVQQDTLLASVENGSIILLCATTENPSFVVSGALLSRLETVSLEALDPESLHLIIEKAEKKHPTLLLTPDAKKALIELTSGDARALLNMIEQLLHVDETITKEALSELLSKKQPRFDPTGEDRYNLISALHKSVRGSDPQAALYWFSRLVVQGEDPRYIGRRLLRMASEDIGLADPEALNLAMNGLKTFETLGSPEGDLALAEVVIYLALAPKSNALYTAYKEAIDAASTSCHLPPPRHIVNAPTKWMKSEGYSAGYSYDHDEKDAFSGQEYFPDGIEKKAFYKPNPRGFERELEKRISYFSSLRSKKKML